MKSLPKQEMSTEIRESWKLGVGCTAGRQLNRLEGRASFLVAQLF